MATKKEAQKEARGLRKRYGRTRTVNVVQVSKVNWGCRFSSKGTRDKFDYRKGK
jgi:hypothetical protein